MTFYRLAAANVRSMWRRFVGLVALLAIAVAVCVTAFAVSGRAQEAADQRVQEGTANRSVTVDRLAGRHGAKPLTGTAVRRLADIRHVASVQPRAQVSFGYKGPGAPGALLYATTARPALKPPVTRSVRAGLFPLRPGEIVLPENAQGNDLSPLLGKKITVQTTHAESSGQGRGAAAHIRVVGLFQPSWQLDGPDAAYADDATVVRWAAAKAGVPADQYVRTVGYDRITVVADSADHVGTVLHAVQAKGYSAASLQQEMTALPGVLKLIRATGRILLVVLGLLALIGALVVTGALARQRVREIGILKAVGFRTRSVLAMLITEMAVVGACGAALGAALGTAGAAATAAGLRDRPDLGPYLTDRVPLPGATALSGVLLLTIAVTVLGACLPARRAARLPPADAVREW
ncbi:ABC transporter permease [Streptomyces sp. NBS 14/10]|uniref:FtsX-like permease family protein n=1 Tax=Streptomyces sp. NBS 14/10 TaxID=1945643 RepID=UPI000B7E9163|nr:ABC transporter permease [Streptomyces sp. NBS 14/10]KAK1181413.1 ABC transporter permease [Streptomyces sp. NBS 14/10]NUS87355.1 ABC transporter permease [Streptomyces sp.]